MFFYQKRSRLVLKHQPTANRPNVSKHARGLRRFYHKIAPYANAHVRGKSLRGV